MKFVVEFLSDAIRLEHLAAVERNPEVKAALEKQAAFYRTRAEQRAQELGIEVPTRPAGSGPEDKPE